MAYWHLWVIDIGETGYKNANTLISQVVDN